MSSKSQRTPFSALQLNNRTAAADSKSAKVAPVGSATARSSRVISTATRPATSAATARLSTAAVAAAAPSAAPSSSLASLIQQDKQRARLARSVAHSAAPPQHPAAARLSRVLGSSGLADHLAAKTLQDRAWSLAQEQRFVEWINCQIVGHATPNAVQSEPIIPDALYARYRSAGMKLYSSAAVQSVLVKVDGEVDAGRVALQLRASRLGEDVEQRAALLAMLHENVSPFWLRLGAECVSGFEVPKPRTHETLAKFLGELLFESGDNVLLPRPGAAPAVAELSGLDGEHCARVELAVVQSRAKKGLKRLLHLLFFIDSAKVAGIAGGRPSLAATALSTPATSAAAAAASAASAASSSSPPLLRASSTLEPRSTGALLALVSQRFLNEGDLLRHLGFLGLTLRASDRAQDCLDFSVRNLAVDLRDGVRLARLLDAALAHHQAAHKGQGATRKAGGALVAQPVQLVSQLRIPADTEAKKLHNVGLALAALYGSTSGGLRSATTAAGGNHATRVTAQEIVDGHQLKTYLLCWQLLVRFDVQALVSSRELRGEIARIQRAHARAAVAGSGTLALRQQENLYFGPSEKLQSLLSWVQTVMWAQACSASGSGSGSTSASGSRRGQLLVSNFTSSFRSGVVLCLLVHYYFPALMPLEDIAHPQDRRDKLAWEGEEGKEEEQEEQGQTGAARPEEEEDPEADENAAPAAQGQEHESGWVGSFSCKAVFAQPSPSDQADFVSSRHNFCTLARRLESLGSGSGDCFAGLMDPSLLFPGGMSAASVAAGGGAPLPDERGMVSFLSFLASRLLILSEEIHACKVIQRATRAFLVRARARRARSEAAKAAAEKLAAVLAKQQALARVKAAQEAEAVALESKRAAQAAKKAADEIARVAREEQKRLRMEAAVAAEVAARSAAIERARLEHEEYHRRVAAEEAAAAAAQTQESLRREAATAAAALKLQSLYRGIQARRTVFHMRVTRMHRAALVIQGAYLCSKARATLAGLKRAAEEEKRRARWEAATRIQCLVRRVVARRMLLALRAADAERQMSLLRHRSALVIQCAQRCRMARAALYARAEAAHAAAQLLRAQRAATSIQCMFRCFVAKQLLCTLRHERLVRAEGLKRQRGAALAIQTWWRGTHARSLFVVHRARVVAACTTMQSAFRAHQARVLCAQLRRQRKEAAELAQRRQHAALTVQCAFRALVARAAVRALRAAKEAALAEHSRRTSAATTIQTRFRGAQARRCFARLVAQKRERLVAEQARFEAEQARLRAEQAALAQTMLERVSATKVQSAFRCFRARRQLATLRMEHQKRLAALEHAVRVASAITIQTHIRAFHARRLCATLHDAKVARLHALNKLREQSALAIQCAARQKAARTQLRALRAAKHAAEAEAARARSEAALTIQCASRQAAARRELQRRAELKRAEMERARVAHERRVGAALVLQRSVRCMNARGALRRLQAAERARKAAQLAAQHRAATTIQSCFRRRRAQRELVQLRRDRAEHIHVARVRAATTLQAHARAMVARRELAQMRAQAARRVGACVAIQSLYRGHKARKVASVLREERESLRAADAVFMAARAQAQLEKAQAASLRLWAAGRLARRVAAAWRRYSTTNAGFLARKYARQHSAATTMQRVVRGFLARVEAARRRSAILQLQAHWRGRAVRKGLHRALRLRLGSIEKKLRLAGRNVQEGLRVGARTRTALETLLSGHSLSGVLVSMQTLASTTALLPGCCVDAVSQNAVPALLQVLRSLNRSKPHLLLLEATLNVFINLAREKKSRDAVLQGITGAALVDAFSDALQTYVAAPTIVLKLVRVMQLGLTTTPVAASSSAASSSSASASSPAPPVSAPALLGAFRSNPGALKRVQGVQSLLERKLALELKASKKTSAATPAPPAKKAAAPKRTGAASASPALVTAVPFDQFWCPCHGNVGSGAPATHGEKMTALQACCDHIGKIVLALQA